MPKSISRPLLLGLLGGLLAGLPIGYLIPRGDAPGAAAARGYRDYQREHAALREAHLERKRRLIGSPPRDPADYSRELREIEAQYTDAYRALRLRHGLPPEKPADEDGRYLKAGWPD